MAYVKTVKQAIMTREEIDTIKRASEIIKTISQEDTDGDYFCEIETRVVSSEWRYCADMLQELVCDCDLE